MAEEEDALDAGHSGNDPSSDPAAIALALDAAAHDASVAAEAAAYLKTQRHLVTLQYKYIADKEHFEVSHLRWRRFTEQMKGALQVMTAVMGLAAAAALGLMVWDAAHANGLLIESFSVPPDMAQKGLTGQVVASQVLDRLTTIQATTLSFRPPLSYANNWGKDIKVEIPETGVSIGEIRTFLREWLGNDQHISGEVWHTDTGIAISARTGGERGETYAGQPSDIDALVLKAAEHIYAQTQPYRYANYVRNKDRIDEARATYLKLTESGSALERGWAWQGIATLPPPTGGSSNRNAAQALRRAIAEYPEYTLGYSSLATAEAGLGHDEAALEAGRNVQRLLDRNSNSDVDPAFLGIARASWTLRLPLMLGDFPQIVAAAPAGLILPDQSAQRFVIRNNLTLALAHQHDAAAAQASFRLTQSVQPATRGRLAVMRLQLQAFRENWPGVLALGTETQQIVVDATREPVLGNPFDRGDVLATAIHPWEALAKAKTGDLAGAQALIATTPGDCYLCVRVRGMVAAQARQWGRADYWFARAAHDGPSMPFAFHDWGRSLLARGKPDGAIEQFAVANKKSPHFADPLEGWGEALMAKNQSHLALAKFAEADKYVPNWGRLHLKWGEALYYAGKRDDAKAQFARAAALDLTPSEKSELARAPHV